MIGWLTDHRENWENAKSQSETYLKKKTCYFSGALSAAQVVAQMSLQKLVGRQWYVQAACAQTGEGIYDALSQLAPMVKQFKKENHR